MESRTTAWMATIVFLLIGAWAFLYRAPAVPELLPQAIFYAVLVLNTFFSIRFYGTIEPKNASQKIVDTVLTLTYVTLGLSLGRPVAFAFAALWLFVVAPQKYALMLGLIPHAALLKKKILIDTMGTVLCTAILGATIAGYSLAAAWALAGLFVLANVYLLLIRPMYRL